LRGLRLPIRSLRSPPCQKGHLRTTTACGPATYGEQATVDVAASSSWWANWRQLWSRLTSRRFRLAFSWAVFGIRNRSPDHDRALFWKRVAPSGARSRRPFLWRRGSVTTGHPEHVIDPGGGRKADRRRPTVIGGHSIRPSAPHYGKAVHLRVHAGRYDGDRVGALR